MIRRIDEKKRTQPHSPIRTLYSQHSDQPAIAAFHMSVIEIPTVTKNQMLYSASEFDRVLRAHQQRQQVERIFARHNYKLRSAIINAQHRGITVCHLVSSTNSCRRSSNSIFRA